MSVSLFVSVLVQIKLYFFKKILMSEKSVVLEIEEEEISTISTMLVKNTGFQNESILEFNSNSSLTEEISTMNERRF